MMTFPKLKFRLALNLLTLVALLFPLASPWALHIAAAAPLQEEPATSSKAEPFDAWTDLFRVWVTFPNAASRARLDTLEVVVLEETDTRALILADGVQLETLARLRFRPEAAEDLGLLAEVHADTAPELARSIQPLLTQARSTRALRLDTAIDAGRTLSTRDALALQRVQTDLRASLQSLTVAQQAGIMTMTSLDSDGDGLTDTEEYWWCTDPLNPDTKGDGVSDGDAVAALMAWMHNELPGPPASGTPFLGWPMVPGDGQFNPNCVDQDKDSVPDLAERWMLGLNPNRESTSRDKFDDGQKLFGITAWGWGALPRTEDTGVIFAEMPSWVKAPGNHPLVAAFPVPEIEVVPSSLRMETVTVVTTDHTVTEGTERSYSTSRTQGTSSSVANTRTWNKWQEFAITKPETEPSTQMAVLVEPNAVADGGAGALLAGAAVDLGTTSVKGGVECLQLDGELSYCGKVHNRRHELHTAFWGAAYDETFDLDRPDWKNHASLLTCLGYNPFCQLRVLKEFWKRNHDQIMENQARDAEASVARGSGGTYFLVDSDGNNLNAQLAIPINFPLPGQFPVVTESSGSSEGGAQTTTHTQYQEHTITNGEAFFSSESWSVATAVNSAHAADLWFTYQVSNSGTEYAREIGNLAFNIYIDDDPHPAITYFVAPDLGGDGKFHNFMPGEQHTYTSRRIPLSLEQMKAVDLGGPLRIEVENFSYGVDELFYQDALNAGVLIAIDNGVDDGVETIETYVLPTWGQETVLDVMTRYFPYSTDAYGGINALWTPHYRADTPPWCREPRVVGIGTQRAVWCKNALSTAEWWTIYTSGLGDGREELHNTLVSPGAVALFRFQKDSDLDGYSDRMELRLGTDPYDPASHPYPELLGGIHSARVGDHVTATLSLLNTGLYDAYGIEAIMIAPNDTISITRHMVGGSGRVRAQNEIIVGSRIALQDQLPSQWIQPGHALPIPGGYYTDPQDRDYTFTVQCGDSGGCAVGEGAWILLWSDDTGNNGSLNFAEGYASPTLLDVGAYGLKLGLLSGQVNQDDGFTIEARPPLDTFQYIINEEPYTPPLVIVSYNDPQGNHRFVIPPNAMALSHPTDDLVYFAGQMLENPGVEFVTTETFITGGNTTNFVVNNPTDVTLVDAHIYLNFISSIVDPNEVVVTVTLPPGPSVVPVEWDTETFSPTFQADDDYIAIAFLTDWQGHILNAIGRPLSSFQADPRAALALSDDYAVWDFSTAQQGTLMKHTFPVANTGFDDLALYLSASDAVAASPTGIFYVSPGDVIPYEVFLNTSDLPLGAYSETLTLRTSDLDHPLKTLHISGTIVEPAHTLAAPLPTSVVGISTPMRSSRTTSASDTGIEPEVAPDVVNAPQYTINSITLAFYANPPGQTFNNAVRIERCGTANYEWLTAERIWPDQHRFEPWDKGSLSGCEGSYPFINWSESSTSIGKICAGFSDTSVSSSQFYDHPNNRCYKVWRVSGGIGQVPIFDIAGKVTDANGNNLSGVTISLSNGTSKSTNSNGNYRFDNVDQGTYTLTASKSGYVFTPASRSVTGPRQPLNTTPDVINQNFQALTPANPVIDSGLDIEGDDVVGTGSSVPVRFRVTNTGQVTWSRSDVRAQATGPATVNFPTQSMNLAHNQSSWYEQTATFDTPGVYTICGGYGDFTALDGGECATLQVLEMEEVRYVRLRAVEYQTLTLGLDFGETGSGAYSVEIDVGGNETPDWSQSGTGDRPVSITTSNLADAFNAYLQTYTGTVDVPIYFRVTALPLHFHSFTAIAAHKPDISSNVANITFDPAQPTEGDPVSIQVLLSNSGDDDSSPFTIAFYADAGMWGNIYMGSALVTAIPMSDTATATVQWDSLGFTGELPVNLIIDPYERMAESNKDNNLFTKDLTILTRPNLHSAFAAFSNPEPIVGETITVSLQVDNLGQTGSGAFATALYDGNPEEDGELLQTLDLTVPGEGAATAEFTWTPTAPGPHRLFALADKDRAINDPDRSNNLSWQDIYVGFAGPLLVNSGGATDPDYTPELGYGALDEGAADFVGACGGFPYERYRLAPDGKVIYRFDHLLPGHFYHLNVTMYECDGAGRQQSIRVNGHLVAGPVDLGDGQVHRLSLLLDPALYTGHTLHVEIEADGIDGAIVNEVNLYDIDYRYADGGGARDPQYPGGGVLAHLGRPYGWLNGVANTAWGVLPYQSVRVNQVDNLLEYRFDGLRSNKRYNVHLTFWQPSGAARIQQVQLDGQDTSLTVNTGDYQVHRETVAVPLETYVNDSSVIVGIVRTNAASGAMLNEIALEEETLPRTTGCDVPQTPYFTDAYGAVTSLGNAAPVGTVIEAISPRGNTVGCFVVDAAGQYGFMRIYGEDATATPPIPGMRAGELVAFRVNGALATATPLLYWQADSATHQINLNVTETLGQAILMQSGWNLISFNLNHPVPTVQQVLSSVDGRYDRVLSETGVYASSIPDVYNTLKYMHPGQGYYVRIAGATAATALIEGVPTPVTTPLPLHAGWNWIGYLPQASLPVTVALQSIEGHYQRVLSLDAAFDPALPEYSTLRLMQPGRGYLLYATQPVTLTYPADNTTSSATPRVTPTCANLFPTPQFTLLYGELLLNQRPAPIGTRIEVLTPRGETAGCFTLEEPGKIGMMPIYGEDATAEPSLGGFRAGEPLAFRVNGTPVATEERTWQDDWTPRAIALETQHIHIYLPLIIRGQ